MKRLRVANRIGSRNMRFHVAEWLVDTAGLDGSEYTALSRLLHIAWMDGGDLPADPDALAPLACLTREDFDKVWPAVSEWFEPTQDGRVRARFIRCRDTSFRNLT